VQGRTQKPELRPELCGTCRICLDGCPGRVFRDLSAEKDTLRGQLEKKDQARGPREQPPCRLTCPLGQDIPGYLNRIASGDGTGALEWILRDNPFPAVLGHVCHHPCESACISGSIQRTPAIRELKRFASMATRPEIKLHSGPSKGKVAIIGAGPAGFAAAWALSREGVTVKVFESLPVPGGLLAWAIPPFRLPRKAVQEDVDYILQHGVDLQLNTHLPPEKVMALMSEYDAVVLACGAPMPKQTDIPGSRLPRVWLGLDFLRQFALGPAPEVVPPVVVIGGGNVATDAARCAIRLASPVTLVYRRDRQEMPAYPEEVEASAAEGIRFLFRSKPVAFEGGPRIGVKQIRIQATSPGTPGKDGRRSFVSLAGTEKILLAKTVILALGQEKGFDKWGEALGLEMSDFSESGFLADRIYAAGDMVTGPATVVEAVAGGINCARRILREVFA
jgi:NADPH-dependent glutamate synthase beta subunit-like oxidoreductase